MTEAEKMSEHIACIDAVSRMHAAMRFVERVLSSFELVLRDEFDKSTARSVRAILAHHRSESENTIHKGAMHR